MLEANWEEATHDQVVDVIGNYLNANETRFVIWETDTPSPPRTRGIQDGERVLRPDVLGVDWLGNRAVGIIEVETASTALTDLAQWQDYDSIAERHNCEFVLIVPEGYGSFVKGSCRLAGLKRLSGVLSYSVSPIGKVTLARC